MDRERVRQQGNRNLQRALGIATGAIQMDLDRSISGPADSLHKGRRVPLRNSAQCDVNAARNRAEEIQDKRRKIALGPRRRIGPVAVLAFVAEPRRLCRFRASMERFSCSRARRALLFRPAKPVDNCAVIRGRNCRHPFAVLALPLFLGRSAFGAPWRAMATMRHGVLVAWLTALFPTEHSFSTFLQICGVARSFPEPDLRPYLRNNIGALGRSRHPSTSAIAFARIASFRQKPSAV